MQDKTKIFNTAFNLQMAGKAKEALKLYLKLIKGNTHNDKLLFLIGTSYLQINEYDRAIHYLDNSIKINPKFQDSYNNRGIALTKKNKYKDSIKDYDIAINLKKDFFDAHLNKGISLNKIKQPIKAIECFNLCIKLKPNESKIYYNLGNVYRNLKNYEQAVKSYSKAIKLNENYAEAYHGRGSLLEHFNHIELASKDYEKAIKLKDDFDFLYGDLMFSKMNICDWNNYDFLKKKIEDELEKKKKIVKPFKILSLNDNQDQHKVTSEIFFKYLHNNNIFKVPKIFSKKKDKIKIGYFSPDFRNHAVLHLILDVFKNHDKSKFEIYGFNHGPKKDELTDGVSKYFYKFFNVYNLTEQEIAVLSLENGIDIAIDLCGHTKHSINQTYYYRTAPIQINYLGYPGTMGNKYYDYIIADKYILPKEEYKNFYEKVLYLPNCYQPNQAKIKISNKNFSKKDFNLPENCFVFGCLNSNYKINPLIFNCWMKILDKCKNSILWLLKENKKSAENLIKEAKKRGINEERIIFAERTSLEIHLKRFEFIDLFLDTYPYGAHTTASEAVRMGIPVLTMIGKSFASRVASSILINVGLEKLVTKNINEYIKIAVGIALDRNKLVELKAHLANPNNTDNLFNSKKFTKDLENIFLNLIKDKI